jgi:hypothetical protein
VKLRELVEPEPTIRMSHAELTELVEVTSRERSRRTTAEMPKLALRGLLLQDLALGSGVVAAAHPAYADSTVPVTHGAPALALHRLAVAFVAAVVAGVLITVPLW